MKKSKRPIKFNFQPYKYDRDPSKNEFAVTKTEDGFEEDRRYLQGVCSGISTDYHGESMSENCIKSFMDQFNDGNLLLFPDVHGVRSTEDVAIAKEACILDNGDWFVKFRLFDKYDDIGDVKLEKVNSIWAQANGLPPYDKPVQKGFSIEGFVPEDKVTEQIGAAAGKTKIIEDVVLDGVVLVPRPAYKTSVAHAVCKCLGRMHPERRAKVRKSISEKLRDQVDIQDMGDEYHEQRWNISNGLDVVVKDIMKRPDDDTKEDQLEVVFEEYKELMIELLMKSEQIFIEEEEEGATLTKAQRSMIGACSRILKNLDYLVKVKKSIKKGTSNGNQNPRKTLT